jgi:hypothetical protein
VEIHRLIDRHALSVVARVAAGLLAAALLVHHWSGAPGTLPGDFYLSAALLMCLGLVLLSDPLIEEAGLRATAKLCGYAGLAGIALATVF